ncbi:MAG: hypothetical protein OEW64_00015 [Gammaproteobacteria bacterium]|nr:hypothetical protein [Gammaproteobacteria bacterium]MDH5302461.1 hypothetical protein [Gammaproteobacteria bacterium]MDH5321343.1 hypothetical protein [Gammaproteobacteria bacterium]
MSLFSRQNCLILLALLLLSHAALTLHVSTHIPVDQAKCEYCAGNVNPSHSVSVPMVELPRPAAMAIASDPENPPPTSVRLVSYQERAPPVLV